MVDIRVDLTTLAGLTETAAEIPGWGPVIADIARQVVSDQPHAEWRYTVTDQNQVLADGTTRRRPTIGLRRRVETRRQTCVFPGCRMPARQSDLDHTNDHVKGGPTSYINLAPLCRHDHRLKHVGGWKLEKLDNGAYKWTSRLGQTYITQPQGP